ncbi:MAG: SCO family protein [Rhodobacterales bacterium 32-66-7]|nr:MAG: SCO family protein [Rhodobacterales bacterium 12-65-15]OYX24673.1 MAG: SCO family protein [Rhodobacterales bacterium 32-66-7]
MTRLYATVAAAAVISGLVGLFAYVQLNQSDDQFAQCRQGQVAGGDIGGPFTLVNPAGETVTEAEVLQKPSLVYFGYTFCPDVCPFDVARNVDAVDLLAAKGLEVTPVFISIDPKRDTPEALGEYAANMHPKLIALTGSEDQVSAASLAYKTFYNRQDSGDDFYLVDHTTFTYLMLPGVGFVDFFRRDITSDAMADAVACYVKAATP